MCKNGSVNDQAYAETTTHKNTDVRENTDVRAFSMYVPSQVHNERHKTMHLLHKIVRIGIHKSSCEKTRVET
jgi:hypothetical protein